MAKVENVAVPLVDLHDDETNPKDHDLPAIMDSLRRHGYIEPIIVRPRKGKGYTIVSGHGRTHALGLMFDESPHRPPENIDEIFKNNADHDAGVNDWEVPVLLGRWRSAAEARAYLIAANRTGELGGWVGNDAVANVLREIIEETGTLVGTGYDGDDLDRMLGEIEASYDGESPPDEFPTVDGTEPGTYRCPSCYFEWSGKPRPTSLGDDEPADDESA